MALDIKKWLADYYNIDKNNIENILKSEKATTYLLIWPIFEQRIFNGFMKVNDIKTVASKFSPCYDSLNVESIARKFHDRYQDKNKYRNLIHNQNPESIKKIFDKQYDSITTGEKLEMLFFVVYRYRNNIFHGNKKVLAWNHYTEQIEDCMAFMKAIIDCPIRSSEM